MNTLLMQLLLMQLLGLTYRICNPTIGFSKYEFNNKVLVGVTFFKVTSGVT